MRQLSEQRSFNYNIFPFAYVKNMKLVHRLAFFNVYTIFTVLHIYRNTKTNVIVYYLFEVVVNMYSSSGTIVHTPNLLSAPCKYACGIHKQSAQPPTNQADYHSQRFDSHLCQRYDVLQCAAYATRCFYSAHCTRYCILRRSSSAHHTWPFFTHGRSTYPCAYLHTSQLHSLRANPTPAGWVFVMQLALCRRRLFFKF